MLVANDMEAHEYCRFVNMTATGPVLQDPDPARCTTGGSVMTAFLSVVFGFMGMLQALPSISSIAAAKASAAAIFAVLDAPEEAIDALAEEPEDSSASKRAAGLIELRDVSFAYPARKEVSVYSGLNLTIEAGQVVALAGPSGCGKSTLVALLERWYDVDGGALLLDGADVRSMSVRWLRSQIGLVSQEPVLFSGTVGWNIGLGAASAAKAGGDRKDDDDASVVNAARQANAHEFVSAMPDGYSTQVGEKGIQLSGGQKQRIAIARALVREPAVLVLDEATSALDAASERVVQAALDEIMTKQKRTTIIIAHRLSTIRNADKICVISGGQVVEEGPHDELLAGGRGIYRALVAHSEGAPVPA
jgi:ATP-binding cassette subfamily B (MDR/TAP) protein 1